MAWTAPRTWVANATLTAAQLNTDLRDNLNETAPAKATAAGQIFVSTGANVIEARTITRALISTEETTTSDTYVDLTTVGPAVTITTGTQALVFFGALASNNTAGLEAVISVGVSGATTLAESDTWAGIISSGTAGDRYTIGQSFLFTALTAGSNTFTTKYRRAGGGTASFQLRRIHVVAL